MTFLQHFWPPALRREIDRLRYIEDDVRGALEIANQEWDRAVNNLAAVTAERSQWIKTATRLRVERDQAKDALEKVEIRS